MNTWKPGDRVEWSPNGPAIPDYGTLITGVVADAAHWPEIDPMVGFGMATGERIPVDLDTPITFPTRKTSRPYTMTRLYVRAQYLEAQR